MRLKTQNLNISSSIFSCPRPFWTLAFLDAWPFFERPSPEFHISLRLRYIQQRPWTNFFSPKFWEWVLNNVDSWVGIQWRFVYMTDIATCCFPHKRFVNQYTINYRYDSEIFTCGRLYKKDNREKQSRVSHAGALYLPNRQWNFCCTLYFISQQYYLIQAWVYTMNEFASDNDHK